jgi:hypothetical protein
MSPKQGAAWLARIRFGHTRVTSVTHYSGGAPHMSILWIILIVILVLALLGFFGRGRF